MKIFAIAAGIVPIVLFGHSYGPPPRVTGAPGDASKACTLCHVGGAVNSGKGSVQILLPSGSIYIPGVKQRLMVQVSDPTQSRWGFELTARLNSDLLNGQAGDFTPVDNMTQVICEDNGPKPCAQGVLFIEHTSAGSRNGTKGGATFQFDWTPPATADAGPVTLYVAGNAANGNQQDTGDLIYTSKVELTPLMPVAPSVATGSIVSAATLTAGPVAANSWVTIYGSNLGVTTRSWNDGDFLNGGLPTSLDGVSVIISQFGSPREAYVGYVSPSQVNFVLPSDAFTGPTTVQVRNSAGISDSLSITLQNNAPQWLTLDGHNVYATHADGTFVGPASVKTLTPATPAKPGEMVTVFGTGWGATNPALIPGLLPATAAPLARLPQINIGGTAVPVASASVVPYAAGLYQAIIQIPADAPNGAMPLVILAGTTNSAPAVIAVLQQ